MDQMRAEFGAEAPSREETELVIEKLRNGSKDCVKEVPTRGGRVSFAEAELLFQDLRLNKGRGGPEVLNF